MEPEYISPSSGLDAHTNHPPVPSDELHFVVTIADRLIRFPQIKQDILGLQNSDEASLKNFKEKYNALLTTSLNSDAQEIIQDILILIQNFEQQNSDFLKILPQYLHEKDMIQKNTVHALGDLKGSITVPHDKKFSKNKIGLSSPSKSKDTKIYSERPRVRDPKESKEGPASPAEAIKKSRQVEEPSDATVEKGSETKKYRQQLQLAIQKASDQMDARETVDIKSILDRFERDLKGVIEHPNSQNHLNIINAYLKNIEGLIQEVGKIDRKAVTNFRNQVRNANPNLPISDDRMYLLALINVHLYKNYLVQGTAIRMAYLDTEIITPEKKGLQKMYPKENLARMRNTLLTLDQKYNIKISSQFEKALREGKASDSIFGVAGRVMQDMGIQDRNQRQNAMMEYAQAFEEFDGINQDADRFRMLTHSFVGKGDFIASSSPKFPEAESMESIFTFVESQLVTQGFDTKELNMMQNILESLIPVHGDIKQIRMDTNQIITGYGIHGEKITGFKKVMAAVGMILGVLGLLTGLSNLKKIGNIKKLLEAMRMKRAQKAEKVTEEAGRWTANSLITHYFAQRQGDTGTQAITRLSGDNANIQPFTSYFKKDPSIMKHMESLSNDEERIKYIGEIHKKWISMKEIRAFIKQTSTSDGALPAESNSGTFFAYIERVKDIVKLWGESNNNEKKQELIKRMLEESYRQDLKLYEKLGVANKIKKSNTHSADNTLDFPSFKEKVGEVIQEIIASYTGNNNDHGEYKAFLEYLEQNPSVREKIIRSGDKGAEGKKGTLTDIFAEWRIQKMEKTPSTQRQSVFESFFRNKMSISDTQVLTKVDVLSNEKFVQMLHDEYLSNPQNAINTLERISLENKSMQDTILSSEKSMALYIQSTRKMSHADIEKMEGYRGISVDFTQLIAEIQNDKKHGSLQSLFHEVYAIRKREGFGHEEFAKLVYRKKEMIKKYRDHLLDGAPENTVLSKDKQKLLQEFSVRRLEEIKQEMLLSRAKVDKVFGTDAYNHIQEMELLQRLRRIESQDGVPTIIEVTPGRCISILRAGETKDGVITYQIRFDIQKGLDGKHSPFPDFGGAIPISINTKTGVIQEGSIVASTPKNDQLVLYKNDLDTFIKNYFPESKRGIAGVEKAPQIGKKVLEYPGGKISNLGTRMDDGKERTIFLIEAEKVIDGKRAKFQLQFERRNDPEGWKIYVGTLSGGTDSGVEKSKMTQEILKDAFQAVMRNSTFTQKKEIFGLDGVISSITSKGSGIIEYFRMRGTGPEYHYHSLQEILENFKF